MNLMVRNRVDVCAEIYLLVIITWMFHLKQCLKNYRYQILEGIKASFCCCFLGVLFFYSRELKIP